MTNPAHVAVLTSHPIQYNAPLFKRLAESPELDLTVLYSSTLGTALSDKRMLNFDQAVVWDIDLLGGYRWKLLRNPLPAHPQRRWSFVSPQVFTELASRRYDVLISFGWAYPVDWLSFFTARLLGIPFLLYGDTDVRDPGSSRTRTIRSVAMSWLCQHASGALYTGTFNRDFYIRHGMSPERLWFSPWAVDNERFASRDREKARASLGLDDGVCYFLFVGTLVPRKCPDLLVSAVADLQGKGHSVGLILAGSGPMEADLRQEVVERRMTDVHFLGFVNQSQMPLVYAAGDVFVLPSHRDPRGTVINEAMAAGLPVIVSSGTGVWGPGDLVEHGREGLVFPSGELSPLRDACLHLTDLRARADMGRAASARIERWGYGTAVAGWWAAINATVHGQAAPPPVAGPGEPNIGHVAHDHHFRTPEQ
jgi:glycosyltransferase involved in cell wall biosynthesis